eukprot:11203303-Lingulodinium_polyedra.AAC.1
MEGQRREEQAQKARAADCQERGNRLFVVQDFERALHFNEEGLVRLRAQGPEARPGIVATLHANSAQALLGLRR